MDYGRDWIRQRKSRGSRNVSQSHSFMRIIYECSDSFLTAVMIGRLIKRGKGCLEKCVSKSVLRNQDEKQRQRTYGRSYSIASNRLEFARSCHAHGMIEFGRSLITAVTRCNRMQVNDSPAMQARRLADILPSSAFKASDDHMRNRPRRYYRMLQSTASTIARVHFQLGHLECKASV